MDALVTKCDLFAKDYDSKQLSRAQKLLDAAFAATVEVSKDFCDKESRHSKLKDKDSFKKLAEKAVATIGMLQPKQLDSQRGLLLKALAKYRDIMEAQGAELNDEYTTKATKYANFLIITRVEINLIHNLQGPLSGDPLRAMVQPDVKDLRAAGMKEKEVLHKIHFSSTNDALQLKKR